MTGRGASRARALLAFAALLVLAPVDGLAQINPWIANDVYDPQEWDSAGPDTATPWLHPPDYKPDQGWGILPPDSALEGGRWHHLTNLTGSWGGARDRLMEHGLAVSLAYFGQFSTNPIGGEHQGGTTWRGDMAAGIFVDLERVAGWHRTYFTATADWKAGTDSLTPAFIGNQLPVQLDNGDDGGATRLVNLALGKQLFDNTAEIVLGRVITGEEFATLRLACTSLNQGICGVPIAAAQSISFPTFPSAVWGGHFKVKPGTRWNAQVGSYLVFPEFRDPSFHGVNFSAPEGSGALTLGQVMYFTGGDETSHPTLPGRYILGGYWDGETVTDVETETPARGTGGVYLMGQQMLFAERPGSDVGLSAWLSLSWAAPNRNQVSNMAAGGLSYQGIVPSRPWDALSFIGAWAGYSADLRDGQRTRGEPVQHGEVLLELNYRLQLAKSFWIQPDVQGIVQPKGRSDINDAIAIGFAVGVVL
ncbi:MAG: carbohydrate porin [Deltaproteobacteria bacterium]|nr:carbohydrate porin [Deltaproteobacteria bacterium]